MKSEPNDLIFCHLTLKPNMLCCSDFLLINTSQISRIIQIKTFLFVTFSCRYVTFWNIEAYF